MIAIDYSNKKEKSQKFKNFLNMPIIQVFAKTIASDLVSVKPMNEPSGICFNTDMLIPKWAKQHRCIQLIENDIK